MFYERWIDCNHLDFGISRVKMPVNTFFTWWPITLRSFDEHGLKATASANAITVELYIDPLLCIVEDYRYVDVDGKYHRFILDGLEYREVREAA